MLLSLFKTLTGYISGATILLSNEFFRDVGEFITKTLVRVSFLPSTFLWVLLKERCFGWRYFASLLFAIEAGLLTLYMLIASYLSPLSGSETPETMVIVVIPVLAMSLHNVHSMQVMPEKAQIAITGLFGNFASSTVHLIALARTGKTSVTDINVFMKLLYPLIAFFGGAFFGAFGFTSLGFIALSCPISIFILIALLSLTVQQGKIADADLSGR